MKLIKLGDLLKRPDVDDSFFKTYEEVLELISEERANIFDAQEKLVPLINTTNDPNDARTLLNELHNNTLKDKELKEEYKRVKEYNSK